MPGATVTAGRAPDPSPAATAIRRGAGVLRAMHKASQVTIDGPTPERIAQAGPDFELGEAVRSVEITKGGQRQTEQIRTPRARVGEDPFTRMLQRGELDPECEDTNRTLGAAGLRYRRLHETAGRSDIRGQDFSRGFTTSAGPGARLDRALDALDVLGPCADQRGAGDARRPRWHRARWVRSLRRSAPACRATPTPNADPWWR